MVPSQVSSHASLLPAIPLTMAMKPGQLRLAEGRLRFTSGIDVLLDAPVGEIHSPAAAVMGIHVWHGSTRYRFALGRSNERTLTPRSPAPAHRLPGDLDESAGTAALAAAWLAALQPVVGGPPPGIRVHAPWPRAAWVAGVVALSMFFVAAIVVLVRIKN